jgi:peptidyl-prolyl cis-trans isomerase SurA
MRKLVLLLAVAVMMSPLPAFAQSNSAKTGGARVGIAAIVNDEAITMADIDSRMQLYAGGRNMPQGEQFQAMQQQALDKLIDERLQMQEAKTLGITVGDDQLKTAFASIAQKNNAAPDEFKARMQQSGLNIDTLYDQLRAELAWGQVVRRRLRPQINISDAEIESEMSLIAEGRSKYTPEPEAPAVTAAAGSTMIDLKQLVIPVAADDPEPIIAAKMSRAIALREEIKSCADMDVRMKEFDSPGTKNMGQLPLGSAPPPIFKVIENLPDATLSAPVRGSNGIAVFMICGRETTAPAETATGPGYAVPDAAAPNAEGTKTEIAREDVANKLGMNRLLQMAERYLRDLRAAAFIDRRI